MSLLWWCCPLAFSKFYHWGFPYITVSFQLVASPSPFNWWEKFCYIFLKKISSSNAFYVFLPIFKHQTMPYIVKFVQKFFKICLSFLFSNRNRKSVGGASQQQQQSHMSTIQIQYTLYSTVFYLIYNFLLYICEINAIKLLQYILFFLFHIEISLFKQFPGEFNVSDRSAQG